MAKKGSVVAAGTERVYIVNLRKEVLKQTRVQKANRAVHAIQDFMERHMKADNVWISPKVNDAVWARGIHRPPSKIKVKAKKYEEGLVKVRLPEEIEEVPKAAEKKSKLDMLKEAAKPGAEREKAPVKAEKKPAAEAEKKEGQKK